MNMQSVRVTDPRHGPVHVDDGGPLVFASGPAGIRRVNVDQPIVRALIADGVLAVVPPPATAEKPPAKTTASRRRKTEET